MDHDFWLVDEDLVVLMHYDDTGQFLGGEALPSTQTPRYVAVRDVVLTLEGDAVSGRFGLVVKFTLKPGHEEAFDKLVSDTLPGIKDREPGTLIYTCHRVRDAPGERLFYELYQDREAFDAHGQQPHVRRFLAEREQHLEGAEVDFLTLSDGKGLPADSS